MFAAQCALTLQTQVLATSNHASLLHGASCSLRSQYTAGNVLHTESPYNLGPARSYRLTKTSRHPALITSDIYSCTQHQNWRLLNTPQAAALTAAASAGRKPSALHEIQHSDAHMAGKNCTYSATRISHNTPPDKVPYQIERL
jgi:hypothetical protein